MFKLLNKMKGQSTLEYAILVIIIIGALLTIQVYIKRGVQGRLKQSADDIGDQFDPGNTNVIKISSTKGKTRELFGIDSANADMQGVGSKVIIDNEVSSVEENSQIINVDQTYWGR